MKMQIRSVLLIFIFMITSSVIDSTAQTRSMKQIQRRSHRKEKSLDESKKVRKAKEKAEDQKEEHKEAYERAKEKDNEHRMDLQTAETKERIKENRKKADEFNSRNREPFFKRIFKRKKPKSL